MTLHPLWGGGGVVTDIVLHATERRISFGCIELTVPGSKGGAVMRALASYQCGPGSNPGVDAICGLSLLLVLFFAPRGFSPGYSGFPLSISKFQFDQESGRRRTTLWMCFLQIIIYLLKYYIALFYELSAMTVTYRDRGYYST